jgi:hypothetical protein
MAQADDEPNTPAVRVPRAPNKTVRREVYVRPGFRSAAEVSREISADNLRGLIVSRRRKAFGLHPDTGKVEIIDPERFCAESAVEVLERGFYFEHGGKWGYSDDDEREWVADYYPVFIVVEDTQPAPRLVSAIPAVPGYTPPRYGAHARSHGGI